MTFIGVPDPLDGSEAQQAEFIDRITPPISHVLDDPISVWAQYEVSTQPSMVFVGSDGTATLHSGSIDAMSLLETVEELATS